MKVLHSGGCDQFHLNRILWIKLKHCTCAYKDKMLAKMCMRVAQHCYLETNSCITTERTHSNDALDYVRVYRRCRAIVVR